MICLPNPWYNRNQDLSLRRLETVPTLIVQGPVPTLIVPKALVLADVRAQKSSFLIRASILRFRPKHSSVVCRGLDGNRNTCSCLGYWVETAILRSLIVFKQVKDVEWGSYLGLIRGVFYRKLDWCGLFWSGRPITNFSCHCLGARLRP